MSVVQSVSQRAAVVIPPSQLDWQLDCLCCRWISVCDKEKQQETRLWGDFIRNNNLELLHWRGSLCLHPNLERFIWAWAPGSDIGTSDLIEAKPGVTFSLQHVCGDSNSSWSLLINEFRSPGNSWRCFTFNQSRTGETLGWDTLI